MFLPFLWFKEHINSVGDLSCLFTWQTQRLLQQNIVSNSYQLLDCNLPYVTSPKKLPTTLINYYIANYLPKIHQWLEEQILWINGFQIQRNFFIRLLQFHLRWWYQIKFAQISHPLSPSWFPSLIILFSHWGLLPKSTGDCPFPRTHNVHLHGIFHPWLSLVVPCLEQLEKLA